VSAEKTYKYFYVLTIKTGRSYGAFKKCWMFFTTKSKLQRN